MAAEKAILTKYAKLCTSTKCCEHSQLNRSNATAAEATAVAAAPQPSSANGENNNVEQINIADHSAQTTTTQPSAAAASTEAMAVMEATENGNTIPDAVNKLFVNY